jgi:hypothetical protein
MSNSFDNASQGEEVEVYHDAALTQLQISSSKWVSQENGSRTYSCQILNGKGDVQDTKLKGTGAYFQKGGMIPRSQAYKKMKDRDMDKSWKDYRDGGFVLPLSVSQSSELFKYIGEVERALFLMASEKKLVNPQHKIVSKCSRYESTHTTKLDLDKFCLSKYHVQDSFKPLCQLDSSPIPDPAEYVLESIRVYPSSMSIVSNNRQGIFSFHVKFRVLSFVVAPKMSSEEVFAGILEEPQSAYQRAVAKIMKEETGGVVGAARTHSTMRRMRREVTQHQPEDSDEEVIPDSDDEDEAPRSKRSRRS